MRRWLKRTGYVVLAVVVIVIGAWLVVPPIVRSQLESQLSVALDRKTTVESVSFNPFDLRLTVRNIAVANRSGPAPLLAVDEIVADVSAASVWHRAPVLDALKVVRPQVALGRDHDGRLSIQDLIDRALAPSTDPPQRFSLNNVEIDNASIAFDDGVNGRKHLLAALRLQVPFLSSLPYETAIRVTPHVGGTFNGARFVVAGVTTPFADRREATIDIDLDDLPLKDYVAYLPAKPRVDLAGGALTTRLKLAFVDGKPGEQRLELRGDARLDELAVNRRDGSNLASAKRIAIALDRVNLISGDVHVKSAEIDAPSIEVKRLANGAIEWTLPLVEGAEVVSQPKSSATAADKRTPEVVIDNLALNAGTVSLADEATGFQSTLNDVSLAASNFATAKDNKAHLKVAFVTADRIASFSGEADVEPMVATAKGQFALTKFSLGLLFPYYKSAFAADVQKGSFDFKSGFSLDAKGDLRLSEGEAIISDLRVALPGGREPVWQLARLAGNDIDVDVKAHRVTIGGAQAEGLALQLLREPDGSFAITRLLRPKSEGSKASTEAPWAVVAKKFAMERAAIDFEDRVPQPPVKLAIRDLALSATDVTGADNVRSNVKLQSRVGQRGRLSFVGQASRGPLRVAGDVEASDLGLTVLKSYIEPQLNVVFTKGSASAKAHVSVDASNADALQASWKGDLSIADFAALDKPTASDLANWKSLALKGMNVEMRPFKASVDRISIDDFYARAIVYEDGTLSLARLLTPGAAPEPAAEVEPAPSTPSAERKALPISIGGIDFQRGNVNFSDFFIKPNYRANLTDVTGSISAMSEQLAGDVSVAARLDRSAPVEVKGRIHPFAKELSLDINATARDIDLPPLTPYSVKYAGYGIQKGKLTFEVHYQVEKRKLAADNHLVLDQLTFGERVESPTATKLPVLLAVALLKDSHGVIDLNLPIGGSLDDPQFSVGALIIKVIVNLLTKAATAPFALLSAAFGGKEDLSSLTFTAGSARIEPDAQKRIDTLAKALTDRPALKVEIAGHVDPQADMEALRREAVETSIKRAKVKAMIKEGETTSIDQVILTAEERNRWLKEAYKDSSLPDRPRNALGILKDMPPQEMEAMLYANTGVDEDALRVLANSRAQATKDAIAAKGVPGERLFLVAPKAARSDSGSSQASGTLMRVDLKLG